MICTVHILMYSVDTSWVTRNQRANETLLDCDEFHSVPVASETVYKPFASMYRLDRRRALPKRRSDNAGPEYTRPETHKQAGVLSQKFAALSSGNDIKQQFPTSDSRNWNNTVTTIDNVNLTSIDCETMGFTGALTVSVSSSIC
jgi:hypothetical protein